MVCKLPVGSVLCLEDFLAGFEFLSYYLGDAMHSFNVEGVNVVVHSIVVFVLR